MSIARARHYPQPPPASTVLAGDRCGHGELIGRCPLCRRAAEVVDDHDAPEPTSPRPELTTAAAVVDEDDQDPRNTPWWDR